MGGGVLKNKSGTPGLELGGTFTLMCHPLYLAFLENPCDDKPCQYDYSIHDVGSYTLSMDT